jgi:Tetracyclin repressor-like, C-terminal domain
MQEPDWHRPQDLMRDLAGAADHDDRIAGQVQTAIGQLIVGPIAATGTDHAPERGALIGAQLLGLALCRYILRLEPLASMAADDVVAAVAPSVQRYLTGPLPRP